MNSNWLSSCILMVGYFIATISSCAFDGQGETFNCTHDPYYQMPAAAIQIYHQTMRTFDHRDSRIQSIDPVVFGATSPVQFSRLQVINLMANEILEIGPNTFSKVPRLVTLDLSKNRIVNTNIRAFLGLFELQMLDLSSNNLASLQSGVFDTLASLRQLNLARNKLTVVSMDSFLLNQQLVFLDLGRNLLVQLLPASFFLSINNLDLRHNQLTDVSAIANIKSLMTLRLNNNQLTQLDFANGDLKAVFPNLVEVRVSNNPWNFGYIPQVLANVYTGSKSEVTERRVPSSTTTPPLPSLPPPPPPARRNANCGLPTISYHSGDSFVKGVWPWLVPIYQQGSEGLNLICEGTLISKSLVLTTASCTDFPEQQMTLYISRTNLFDWNDGYNRMATAKLFIRHPEFQQRLDANLALVLLDKSITFDNFVRPICFDTAVEELDNSVNYLVGWQRNEFDELQQSQPQAYEIPWVSRQQCLASSNDTVITERTFCRGATNYRGPCNVNLGEALVAQKNGRWFVNGVYTSSAEAKSIRYCNFKRFNNFVRIASFTDWIQNNVDKYT